MVGAVESTIQLIDFVTKFADRLNHLLNSADEAPQSFQDIRLQLPLFVETLRWTQFHIDHGHYEPLTSKMLEALIEESSVQMISLEKLLEKVTTNEEDTKITKTRSCLNSLLFCHHYT